MHSGDTPNISNPNPDSHWYMMTSRGGAVLYSWRIDGYRYVSCASLDPPEEGVRGVAQVADEDTFAQTYAMLTRRRDLRDAGLLGSGAVSSHWKPARAAGLVVGQERRRARAQAV